MPSFQVRAATLRDASAIAQVHTAALKAAYKDILPEEKIGRMPVEKRQAMWREAIEYSEPQVKVVLDENNKIIGFVGFDRSRDPKTKPTFGEIWAQYVLPSHWGQGAGLQLWDEAREGLDDEGCTEASVWVPLRNERVLRFYELAGFKRELNTARTTPVGDMKIEEIRLKRPI
jgi:ribosomal protein S18 acetylase RimI-like enzyme